MKEGKEITGSESFVKNAVIEIIVSGNTVQEKLSDALKPFNISIAQFNVLRILRGQKGKPASLACVNAKMIHKMSNTTRLIDKLLEKGFVDRVTCPDNRRKIELTITKEGLDFLEGLDEVIEQTQQELMQDFTPNEISEMTNLLKKINNE